MKILYVISSLNNFGGIARVISTKTNYFVEHFGYEIIIVTQNGGNEPLYFEFNSKIKILNIDLISTKLQKIYQYKKQLEELITVEKPNFIITTNFDFNSFLLPYLLNTKIPVVFEAHGSKYNEELYTKTTFYHTLRRKIKVFYRIFLAKKFDFFVALSNESLSEWNVKNGIVIANAVWFEVSELADLNANKVIAVARHSYEKGLDRLLLIWKKIIEKYPNWTLEIYGEMDENCKLKQLSKELKIENNVIFFQPTTAIIESYKSASIYAMTSRNEGFPMVLLEAMTCGLPIIAYDCPVGPITIITNNEDGFLVEDGNDNEFVEKLNLLIEDKELRLQFGKKAHENVAKFNIETIMNQWNVFFESNKKIY